MNPISLYIHIPFCRSKCNYCDFLSVPVQNQAVEAYLDAVIRELKYYSNMLQEKHRIYSIFIGGGTPSILKEEQIGKLFQCIHKYFFLDEEAEITIECNPGTITKDKLERYIACGINRISVGLQSIYDEQLSLLGRIHTYSTFKESYELIKQVGIQNYNIDLMFGLPNQHFQDWEKTLQEIIKLEPCHISCYGLKIEEGTVFHKWVSNNKIQLPSDEEERELYHLACELLPQNQYDQYEISNFSKNSFASKHNLVYWKRQEYIGIGAGAHSYFKRERYHNADTISSYMHNVHNKKWMRYGIEEIDQKASMEEFMFLGLRLTSGVNRDDFEEEFGCTMNSIYGEEISRLMTLGLIEGTDKTISLTVKGIDLSNYVFEKFLLD